MEYSIKGTSRHSNDRRFPHEKGPRPDHAKTKRIEAVDRLETWQGLTPEAQLKSLDKRLSSRLGAYVSHAAVKQRARIQRKIDSRGEVIAEKKVKRTK